MLALCLHGVVSDASTDNEISPFDIKQAKLETLLKLLYGWLEAGFLQRLFITFDDGYRSACHYIQQHAAHYPKASWLMFVCPQAILAAQDPRIAGREEVLALLQISNVALGNHTNRHLDLGTLTTFQWQQELISSEECFSTAFGKTLHFAYPFGIPGKNLHSEHWHFLKDRVECQWSCEPRTFAPEELTSGDPLPRFSIDGGISVKGIVLIIALRSLFASGRRRRSFATKLRKEAG